MEKYTERSVVLIKREIQQLSDQLPILTKEIEGKKKESTNWDSRLEEKKRIFIGYDNFVAGHFSFLRETEKKLNGSIEVLKNKAKGYLDLIPLLRSEVASIEVPEPDFSFAEQVKSMLSEQIKGLSSIYSSKADQLVIVEKRLSKATDEIEKLRVEEKAAKPRIDFIRSEIHLGNDKNGKLGLELLSIEKKIAGIKRREKTAITMQKRLEPEYRKLLGDKLCRKCGNLI